MTALALWCTRHRLSVVLAWALLLLGLGAGFLAKGSAYSSSFELSGTDSAQAQQLLDEAFPGQSGDTATLVWHVDSGTVRASSVEKSIDSALSAISRQGSVSEVVSPYTEAVEVGGSSVESALQSPAEDGEAVGIAAAAIVLFLAFGSLFSMLLPILTAAAGVVTARRDPVGMVTIPRRGYIAMPAALRLRCGLEPGDRVLLAGLPDDRLDEYLRTVQLSPVTDKTITSPAQLLAEVLAARANGWYIADGSLEYGVRAISVPAFCEVR